MKRIVRLTENDLTRIVKRVLKEQSENPNRGNAPFQTLTYAGKEWNLMSPDTKGILKAIHGTLNVYVETSNGEYVVIPTFRFQAGPKQSEYKGELLKKSKSATGPDDVGAWEWRTPFKNNRPDIDISRSYFESDGGQKIPVDKFMTMLSNDKNAMAFVRDILKPLHGIN
jgi:hypothetical protein